MKTWSLLRWHRYFREWQCLHYEIDTVHEETRQGVLSLEEGNVDLRRNENFKSLTSPSRKSLLKSYEEKLFISHRTQLPVSSELYGYKFSLQNRPV